MALEKPALRMENICKRFPIFTGRKGRLLSALNLKGSRKRFEYTALDDINLKVLPGQSLGLIGRNGSGKSTLLRIAAGIMPPTQGTLAVNGRISSILDLQAGFNPLLSGRENIFLKGSLNGLTRKEMRRRCDAIIDFSGLEDFIDYPINTYSTGMVVRLGFAIAIHLDFDVLMVDEVLSVGDVVFQRQCLSKIKSFQEAGKAIVLATHNLGDVSHLCDHAALLKKGQIIYQGKTEGVLASYWEMAQKEGNRIPRSANPLHLQTAYGEDLGDILIQHVSFLGKDGEEKQVFHTGEAMTVRIAYSCQSPVKNPLFRVQFFRSDGLLVHGANTSRAGVKMGTITGKGEAVLTYSQLNLLEGDYYVSVGVWPDEYGSLIQDKAYDCHQWGYVISVESRRQDGGGVAHCPFRWHLEQEDIDRHNESSGLIAAGS